MKNKEKWISLSLAIVSCIFIIFFLPIMCTSNRHSYNIEAIEIGDCVTHKTNSQKLGIVIKASRRVAYIRLSDAKKMTFWYYPEMIKVNCPVND